MATSIYQHSAVDTTGQSVEFTKYTGKVLIVVNVASECGLTKPNYKQLSELYKKYRNRGLDIAAFPCNQFKNQEPLPALKVKNNVSYKYHFKPDFYEKIDVNGDNAHPIFKYLKEKTNLRNVKWNFTKFLINRQGDIIDVFGPTFQPKNMEDDIVKALETTDYVKDKKAKL
ncbi:unnamed protein product [Bursaphelenchus okinawaensis]|uniref:Glutathione peroxidase n=1 Tax=Bursaphelenchus okinawaensis TaxID=465554 RepID=A0A811KEC5_9BILA|nr:unnamed protein product [Bursaphelenchus okinawaensis]CAG9102902.1 unnamed protein product [Bursaphelenchus okinawaensis]